MTCMQATDRESSFLEVTCPLRQQVATAVPSSRPRDQRSLAQCCMPASHRNHPLIHDTQTHQVLDMYWLYILICLNARQSIRYKMSE